MSDDESASADAPRKRGRPVRKRGAFSFRVSPSLRAQLEAAAAAEGRPISDIIESRLEQSFWIQAKEEHDKAETGWWSAESTLERYARSCGGPAVLQFMVTLGALVEEVRRKHGLPDDPIIHQLPEDRRRALYREVRDRMAPYFSVHDRETFELAMPYYTDTAPASGGGASENDV